MKNLLFTAIVTLFYCLSFGQVSESKVKAYANSKYPGYQVSNISGEQLWHNGAKYYWYTFTLRHKVDLPGYPGVTEVAQGSVYYWPNGTKKQDGSYIARFYEGLPKPSKAEVQKALDAIDRPAYFGPDYPGYISVEEITIGDDFTFKWTSEKKVHLEFGSMTYLTTVSPKSTQRIKREIQISLTREDHNKPWIARVGGTANNIEVLEEKKYEGEEWLKIKTSTYAERFAEENAQKEWDALVPIEIPMTSVEDLCEYAHNLFLTGSREEVKSFLFRTTPSGQFWDNSTVRVNYSRRNTINRILKEIFDDPKNYRNEYCETSVISGRSKKGFTYSNHNLTNVAKYDIRIDGDKFCFVDCQIGFSQNGFDSDSERDARKFPCRGDLPLEKFESSEAHFSIDFPANVRKIESRPSRLTLHQYQIEYDAANYWVYCTEMDPNPNISDENRYLTAANTAKQSIEKTDGVISSSIKKITINGVVGAETEIVYNDIGTIRHEMNRFIYLGDNFYEIGVRALKLRENEKAVLETFTCELKGSTGGNTSSGSTTTASLPTSYNEGDQVMVRISQTEWTPGVIEKKNADGKYQVLCPEVNKRYNQPLKNLKPNPIAKKTNSSSKNESTGYSKKDQVLINTSAGWKPGVVSKVTGTGKYVVYCPDTDKSYNATDANLKANPGGKAKEKKKIPGIKLN